MMKKIKKLWLLLLLAFYLIITECASSETSGNKNTSNSNNVNNSSSHLPENYPDKTMNVLVGYAPGGGTDITARKMVEALNEAGIVDQSFVVENMPGAGGAFALRELGSKRKDDPYSLVFEAVYAPSLWNGGVGNLSLEDYKPIAQIAADYVLLAVRSDSPYQTIEDLKQALEKDPQSVVISLGQPLTGDDAWMWNNIKNAIGIGGELSMVSHEGTNPAFNTVLAGDADVVAVNPGLVKDHIEKGTIKALAVTTDERVKELKTYQPKRSRDRYNLLPGSWCHYGWRYFR